MHTRFTRRQFSTLTGSAAAPLTSSAAVPALSYATVIPSVRVMTRANQAS